MFYKSVLFLILLSFILSIYGEDKVEDQIIYEYKKKEFIDLGDLEIKGTLMSPGDITVKSRKIKELERETFFRDNFNKNCIKDILTLM